MAGVHMRLDPAERDRRAKARKAASWDRMRSGEAYSHFDPNDGQGYGSREQWRGAAGQGWTAVDVEEPTPKPSSDLELLGLTARPMTMADLTRAYRRAAFKAHPDTGGSHLAFLNLTAAYDRVSRQVGR